MKYRFVIWDVDGTLLDTREGLISAYRYALDALKLPSKTDEEICSYVGPTPQTIFKTRFGLNDEAAQQAANLFRDRYKTHDLLKARAYDGVYDVMDHLQKNNIKQAIATNKRQDYATEICQHFGFDKYCFPIVGADNENKLTKADLIKKCLETVNVTNLSEAVMIGDTQGDKTAAETVGIDFIGVKYGFGFNNVAGYANTPLDILKLAGE